jgi:hypothetical protein
MCLQWLSEYKLDYKHCAYSALFETTADTEVFLTASKLIFSCICESIFTNKVGIVVLD